ncbi:MAG: hypothetical protein OXF27_03370 [Acidobacteria bacterium]|nr:hypothetical protein [Acidobacteriota bacterium]
MRRHLVDRFRTLLPAAALLLPAAAAAQTEGAGFEAFHGTWTAQSGRGTPAVTMTWEDRGGGIVYVSTTDSSPDAGPLEVFAFRQDGKDYPYAFRGGDVTSTIAAAAIDRNAIDVTYKMGGMRTARSRWSVSGNGSTLTVGRPDGTTWTLARQNASPAQAPREFSSGYKRYVGVWEAVRNERGSNTGTVVWEDRGENFVIATVRDRDGRVTMRYTLKYDGKHYPCVSNRGGVNTITSVFVDDYKTDWSIYLADGSLSGSGSRIVDPDGQRIVVPGSGGGGNDLIWHRAGDAPTDGILAP